MKFGAAEVGASELATGAIHMIGDPLGPVTSPVVLARGAQPGPRLLTACLIHGGENVRPMAFARLLREINLRDLRGRIAGLMRQNPLGHRQHSRLTPQDGMKLSRIFPSKPEGAVTEQSAARGSWRSPAPRAARPCSTGSRPAN
jgi:predicted deacylase